eukprot:m.268921 g.268921  ORF g.268921 m.268921 type:complete len:172 (+) comp17660_c0_seq1:242-757(+)
MRVQACLVLFVGLSSISGIHGELPEGARHNGLHVVRFPREDAPTTTHESTKLPRDKRLEVMAQLQHPKALTTQVNSTTAATKPFVANDEVDTAEAETLASWRIFMVFAALGGCVLLVYTLERAKTQAIPDSVAIIGFGNQRNCYRLQETQEGSLPEHRSTHLTCLHEPLFP